MIAAADPTPPDNSPLGFATRMRRAARAATARKPNDAAIAGGALPTSVHPHETSVGVDVDLFGNPLPRPRPAPIPAPPAEPGPEWATWREEGDHFKRTGRGAFTVPPATPEESLWRHSCWLPRRVKVREAMERINAPVGRVERFDACGSCCTVERSPSTGGYRLRSNHCRDRFCLICGQQRSRLIAANLERALDGREARFITLTLRHTQRPLCDQLTRLLRCFRNLRASRLWKSCVVGGAAFLEVKRSKSGKSWHPHLHVITEGSFLPQNLLSAQWLLTTGDSAVVDVRFVRDRTEVVRYVAKYASKPLDATLFDAPHWLDEAMLALRGRRLCTTFGSWRGVELEECPPDPGDWIPICSLTRMVREAAAGEGWAVALRSLLRRGDPITSQIPFPPENTS